MKHRIALLALVAFLVVDLGLFLAVRQHVQAAPGDDVTATNPKPSASDADKTDDPDPAAAGTQRLELARSGVLARVSPGRCTKDSRPLIEISTDQGASFDEVGLPLLEGDGPKAATVRTVLQVRAASADEITVIGSNEQCRARQFTTGDGGESWEESGVENAEDARDDWYIEAAGTEVVSTDGATEPGCDVVALAPVSDLNAKVACSDGVISGTNDRGTQWVRLGELDNVSDIVFDSVGAGFAVAPGAECKGQLFTTVDAGGQWTPTGCVSEKQAATSLVGSAGRLYALADGGVRVSEDAGETWDDPEEPADG